MAPAMILAADAARTLATFRYLAGVLFPWVAFLQHVLFLSAFVIVARGVRKPGIRLLTLAFASMTFSVFWAMLALPKASNYPMAALSFVLFGCLAYDAWKPETDWSTGKRRKKWERWVGAIAIVWALCHPGYGTRLWMVPFLAPIGVLPGPTLTLLLGALWLAFPRTNRLVHWAAAIAGVLVGLHAIVYLRVAAEIPLLLLAGLTVVDLARSVAASGGITADDEPPPAKAAPKREGAGKENVWKL